MKNNFSAPIRICLSGEDLDWLGFRCCCLAIDLPTRVSFNIHTNPYKSAFVEKAWSLIIEHFGENILRVDGLQSIEKIQSEMKIIISQNLLV